MSGKFFVVETFLIIHKFLRIFIDSRSNFQDNDAKRKSFTKKLHFSIWICTLTPVKYLPSHKLCKKKNSASWIEGKVLQHKKILLA